MPASPASVLVTGATGFIGQRLVRTLLHKGLNVRVLVRPDKSPDSRMPDACEQVPASLTDVESLTTVVARSSAVIYCAGSVRGRSLADFKTANIEGVRAMLEALEQAGNTAPLLLLSSLAASRPELSDYARSKFEGEQLLQDRTSLNWTILRPPAVYGPGDREMLPILKMARKGLLAHAGPVDQRLSLLHVDDLVDAIVTWLSAPEKCQHQTYAIDDGTAGGYSWSNIGDAVSDKQFRLIPVPRMLLKTIANLNLQLAKIFDYAPMLSPGKVRELVQAEWLCDNSSFTGATGWTPKLNLEQGAKQLFGASEDGSKT
ncbi:MAG: NAD(P)-dependent oxidoreductase [Gammaproteobacteria bacterium]|nr:NAD(P)-dependent oxidoreductase [Gammaproteobacteria bacterium]NNL00380.1 NAD(P)-dependent oxidoreductase [Xanthomonadales bacterium]